MRSKGIDTALLEVKEVEEVKKEPYTVDEVNETEEKDLNLDGKVEMSVAQYLELKQELIEAKSGRTISAKHEDLLKNACDQMGGAIGCLSCHGDDEGRNPQSDRFSTDGEGEDCRLSPRACASKIQAGKKEYL